MSLTDNTALSLSIEQAGKPDLFMMETQSNSSTNLGSPALSLDLLHSLSESEITFDKYEPQIECKVETVRDLGVALNFKNICKRLGFGTIIQDRLGDDVLRVNFRYPKVTILVDSMGKARCVDIDDFDKAREATEKLCRYLVRIGYKIKASSTALSSLKVSADLKNTLNLGAISRKFPIQKHLFYEPELFSSLMVTLEDLQVKVVIHENGLLEAKGSKSDKQSKEAISRVANWIIDNLMVLF